MLIEYILANKQESDPSVTWNTLFWYYQYYPIMALYKRMVRYINALNPAMEGLSGLFEISKREIANHLNAAYYPNTLYVRPRTPVSEILQKLESQGVHIQEGVVCKPDMGERSFGVKVIHHARELERYASAAKKPFLVQEKLHHSAEFTLSFFRQEKPEHERSGPWQERPGQEQHDQDGVHQFMVNVLAERILPQVVGDGISSVACLIQQAGFSQKQQANILSVLQQEELASIPALGESRLVGVIGSVDYGIQLVIRELSQEQRARLNRFVTTVLTNAQGQLYDIWFGRFDIRSESFEALLRGDAKIIELNGAMAGPQEGLLPYMDIRERYKVFKQQYEKMHRMAVRNVEAGRGKKNSYITFLWESVKKLRTNPAQWKGTVEALWTIGKAKWVLQRKVL